MEDFWDTQNKIYQEQEEYMLNCKGELKDKKELNFIVSKVITRALDPVNFPDDVPVVAE